MCFSFSLIYAIAARGPACISSAFFASAASLEDTSGGSPRLVDTLTLARSWKIDGRSLPPVLRTAIVVAAVVAATAVKELCPPLGTGTGGTVSGAKV